MRKWIALILILPVLWSGYWAFGSYGLKNEIQNWLTERENSGWQVEYADLRVRGFPNRFDTTLSDLQLTDTKNGISWSAPFFQLLSLSYKPNHVIAVWPNEQTFATPFQNLGITSEDLKASIVLTPDNDLALVRGTIIGGDIRLVSNAGWSFSLKSLSTSIRKLEEGSTYEISSEINHLKPSEKILTWLNTSRKLPAEIETLSADLKVKTTKLIALENLETERPQIKSLDISRVKASWGELQLRASGALTVSVSGELTGEIKLNAKNWRDMIELAVASGALAQELAGTVELGLSFLARLSGSEHTIDAPLTFRNGKLFLGPIPLGSAPRLVIR